MLNGSFCLKYFRDTKEVHIFSSLNIFHRLNQRSNKTGAEKKRVMLILDIPESKVHGANVGHTWVLSAPDGPHVASWTLLSGMFYVVHSNELFLTCHLLHKLLTKWAQTSFIGAFFDPRMWQFYITDVSVIVIVTVTVTLTVIVLLLLLLFYCYCYYHYRKREGPYVHCKICATRRRW